MKNYLRFISVWVLVFATTFYLPGGNYWASHWWSKWAVLLSCASILLSGKIAYKVHWSVGLVTCSVLMTGLSVFAYRDSIYHHWDLESQVAIGRESAYAVVSFLTLGFLFYDRGVKFLTTVSDALAAMCFVNSLTVIGQRFITHVPMGGWFGNPSMTGCLIAFTYPFLALEPRDPLQFPSIIALIKKVACVGIPIFSIALINQSMPTGAMAVTLAAYGALYCHRNKISIFYPVLTCATLSIGFGLYTQSNNNMFFDTTGRMDVWRQALNWWWANGSHLFGTGVGTTRVLLPQIQVINMPKGATGLDWFFWAHSDYVQALFELGIVGFVASLLMCMSAAVRCIKEKEPYLLACLAGVCGSAIGDYPLHLPMHAFAITAIFAMIFHPTFANTKEMIH